MLHGYVDDELDLIHSIELEKHLNVCQACARELDCLTETKIMLGSGQARWTTPATVRRQILRALSAENHARSKSQWESGFLSLFAWRKSIWTLLPSAAALVASAFLFLSRPELDDAIRDQVISSHVHSMLANHLVDVQTSNQHTVKPWFNGKLNFSPPVVDLSSEGFPLVGGRIDYLQNRTVAAIVYRRYGHVINLFVWPSNLLSRGAIVRDGYNIERWSAGGLVFWAVSDVSRDELLSFKQVYSQTRAP